MMALSFKQRQDKFGVVTYVLISITVTVNIFVFIPQRGKTWQNVNLDNHSAVNREQLRFYSKSGLKNLLVTKRVNDILNHSIRSLRINAPNRTVIIHTEQQSAAQTITESAYCLVNGRTDIRLTFFKLNLASFAFLQQLSNSSSRHNNNL